MLPQYARVHPFISIFSLYAFANILGGLILLFFAPLAIALACLGTGILFILATRRSTARRYIVSDYFRPPRHLRASEFLLIHRHRLKFINYAVAIAGTALCFWAFDEGLWRWLAVVLLAVFSSMILIAAIKMHIKFWIDTHFRIVVFRRYEGEASLRHKARILPICGFYGQVLLFEDDKLSDAWEGGLLRMEQWVFAELYQPLAAERKTESWRALVCEQLCYADFVLFDWSAEITDNMIWEFEQALERVPPDRILILESPESAARIEAILQRPGRGAEVRHRVTAAPTSGLGEAIFIIEFMESMRCLRPQPRPPEHLVNARIP